MNEWIRTAEGLAQVGEEAAQTLADLFRRLSAHQDAPDGPAILRALVADPEVSGSIRELAQRFIDEDRIGRLKPWFQPLHAVEAESEANRTFGWPEKSWTRHSGAVPSQTRASLELTGAARLVIEAEREAAGDAVARTRLQLLGHTNGALAASRGAASTVGASGAGRLERSVTYRHTLDAQRLVFEALARNIRTLGAPVDDYAAVHAAMFGAEDAHLDAITITGGHGMNAALSAQTQVPLSAGVGTASFAGKIRIDDDFRIEIQRLANSRSIRLTANREQSGSRSVSIGVGYTLGISDLSPATIAALIQSLGRADRLLQDADGVVSDFAQWLRPGSALQSFMEARMTEHLGVEGNSLQEVLATWLGEAVVDPDELSSIAAREIGRALDDAPDIFGRAGVSRTAMDAALNDLLQVTATQTRTALEALVDKISSELDANLATAARQIDDGTVSFLNAQLGTEVQDKPPLVREYLARARRQLDALATGIAASNQDLLAAEVAYERAVTADSQLLLAATIAPNGRDFYALAVRQPEKAIELATQGDSLAGVSEVHTALSTGGTRNGKLAWRAAALDLAASGSNETLVSAQITATQSGVTVATDVRTEKVRRLATDARSVAFVDVLALANTGEISAATMSLRLNHTDGAFFGGWSEREIKRFLNPFNALGMSNANLQSALLDAFNKERAALGGVDTVNASLTVSLALPADRTAEVYRRLFETQVNRAEVRQAIAEGLLADSDNREAFRRALEDAINGQNRSSRRRAAAAFGGQLINDRVAINTPTTALANADNRNTRRLGRAVRGPYAAMAALLNYLETLQSIYAQAQQTGNEPLRQAQLEQFRDQVLDEHEDAAKRLNRRWLKTGLLPVRAEPPDRTVALFEVLRNLSARMLGEATRPPVLFRFEMEARKPQFFSIAQSDGQGSVAD